MQIEDNSEIFWYNIGRDRNERLHKGFCGGKDVYKRQTRNYLEALVTYRGMNWPDSLTTKHRGTENNL